ncbi:hypothetical protein DdX_12398 [Ditylenchus destructor]|uniref:Uncharacterized protein n=1 Tax=Ditylenchus destructor TaxID=166010 RepID=A0AAD4MZ03_9BILA|nr:hypothetical protein DdX_12398 [Ditylenchus destructor]
MDSLPSFVPVIGSDTKMINGAQYLVGTKLLCLTASPRNDKSSLEEHRLKYYNAHLRNMENGYNGCQCAYKCVSSEPLFAPASNIKDNSSQNTGIANNKSNEFDNRAFFKELARTLGTNTDERLSNEASTSGFKQNQSQTTLCQTSSIHHTENVTPYHLGTSTCPSEAFISSAKNDIDSLQASFKDLINLHDVPTGPKSSKELSHLPLQPVPIKENLWYLNSVKQPTASKPSATTSSDSGCQFRSSAKSCQAQTGIYTNSLSGNGTSNPYGSMPNGVMPSGFDWHRYKPCGLNAPQLGQPATFPNSGFYEAQCMPPAVGSVYPAMPPRMSLWSNQQTPQQIPQSAPRFVPGTMCNSGIGMTPMLQPQQTIASSASFNTANNSNFSNPMPTIHYVPMIMNPFAGCHMPYHMRSQIQNQTPCFNCRGASYGNLCCRAVVHCACNCRQMPVYPICYSPGSCCCAAKHCAQEEEIHPGLKSHQIYEAELYVKNASKCGRSNIGESKNGVTNNVETKIQEQIFERIDRGTQTVPPLPFDVQYYPANIHNRSEIEHPIRFENEPLEVCKEQETKQTKHANPSWAALLEADLNLNFAEVDHSKSSSPSTSNSNSWVSVNQSKDNDEEYNTECNSFS